MNLPKVIKIRGQRWVVYASGRTGFVELKCSGRTIWVEAKPCGRPWQDVRDGKLTPTAAEYNAAWEAAFRECVEVARKS